MSTLRLYLCAVRQTLNAAMCLEAYPPGHHAKSEIETRTSKELILNPLIVSRYPDEKVLIETSINSIRVSIQFSQPYELDRMLVQGCTRFINQHAEGLDILRRKPVPGYDISLLITNEHLERMSKKKLIDLIINFMEDIKTDVLMMRSRYYYWSLNMSMVYLEGFLFYDKSNKFL